MTLKLDRTRDALANLDRIDKRLDTVEDADEAHALLAEYEMARAEVGQCFYLDTADRNTSDCAGFSMCGAGLDFMRSMVEWSASLTSGNQLALDFAQEASP